MFRQRLIQTTLVLFATIVLLLLALPNIPAFAQSPATPVPASFRDPTVLNKGGCAIDQRNLAVNGAFRGSRRETSSGVVAESWDPFILSGTPRFEVVDNEGAPGDDPPSQQIFSSGKFDAGIRQTVRNLKPGTMYWYRVGYFVAAKSIDGPNVDTDTMARQIGVDPTGGTDPRSANVTWGPTLIPYKRVALNHLDLILLFPARTDRATFFIRGIARDDSQGENRFWIDAICMEARTNLATVAPPRPTNTRTATPQPATATPPPTDTPTPTDKPTSTPMATATPPNGLGNFGSGGAVAGIAVIIVIGGLIVAGAFLFLRQSQPSRKSPERLAENPLMAYAQYWIPAAIGILVLIVCVVFAISQIGFGTSPQQVATKPSPPVTVIYVIPVIASPTATPTRAPTNTPTATSISTGRTSARTPTPRIPATATPTPVTGATETAPTPATTTTRVSAPSASFTTLPVPPPLSDRPAAQHADLNLALRGFMQTQATLQLIDLQGATDAGGPQLKSLFADNTTRQIKSAYQVRNWDWGCNCRTNLIDDPEVTLIGLSATPGEALLLPNGGSDIMNNFRALVLYADADRITLKYTRSDTIVGGYALHIEGIQVDPNLVELYQRMNSAGRGNLPALRARQAFGTATSSEVKVAVRDSGAFMDPRSRKDWWR